MSSGEITRGVIKTALFKKHLNVARKNLCAAIHQKNEM
jgi:hypothetical protein